MPTLTVKFTGLCLFVGDNNANQQCRVLLLDAKAAGKRRTIPRHHPLLVYDAQYSTGPGRFDAGKGGVRRLEVMSLRNVALDLSGIGRSDPIKQDLANAVLTFTNTTINSQWFTREPGSRIQSQVFITTGRGTGTGCGTKDTFAYPENPDNPDPTMSHAMKGHQFASYVSWEFPDVGSPLILYMKGLNGADDPQPLELDSNGTDMELLIENVPRKEFMPMIPMLTMNAKQDTTSKRMVIAARGVGMPVDHVRAYRGLLGLPAFPIPVLAEMHRDPRSKLLSGNAATCMPGFTPPK